MKKTINVISYKPGYGGNFIGHILSLDEITFPLVPKGSVPPYNRKNLCSFKNIINKHGSWAKFHLSFEKNRLSRFLNDERYSIYNCISHAETFFDENFQKELDDIKDIVNVNYLQVQLSLKFEYIIEFFMKFVYKTVLETYEEYSANNDVAEKKFFNLYNPTIINLDNFILGKEEFIVEYTKISNLLQIPLHIDDAIELYDAWRIERKIKNIIRK
jgi:hypothetical protein